MTTLKIYLEILKDLFLRVINEAYGRWTLALRLATYAAARHEDAFSAEVNPNTRRKQAVHSPSRVQTDKQPTLIDLLSSTLSSYCTKHIT